MDRRLFIATGIAAAGLWTTRSAAAQPDSLTLPKAPIEGLTIAPEFYPTVVSVKREFPVGSIIVISQQHFLYYIARPGTAIRYGVAVGRNELVFKGEAVVGAMKEWPTWKPTPEMVARSPKKYAKYADTVMPGGPGNPLGARAIYLFQNGADTGIRIHGTIEPNSIGTSVSNGCLRMVNEHVIDLYARVQMGAPVTVY
jgi:lipoprotein-anchoring transpeptidase ErfK/SrfK